MTKKNLDAYRKVISDEDKAKTRERFVEIAKQSLEGMAAKNSIDIDEKCCVGHRIAIMTSKYLPRGGIFDPNNIHSPTCWRFQNSVMRMASAVISGGTPAVNSEIEEVVIGVRRAAADADASEDGAVVLVPDEPEPERKVH